MHDHFITFATRSKSTNPRHQAYDYAYNMGAHIASCSFGPAEPNLQPTPQEVEEMWNETKFYKTALDPMVKKGMLVVAAAGEGPGGQGARGGKTARLEVEGREGTGPGICKPLPCKFVWYTLNPVCRTASSRLATLNRFFLPIARQ